MKYQEVSKIIDSFLNEVKSSELSLNSYESIDFPGKTNKKGKIGVQLNNHKEIVLDSETGLELGGINKKSFSLVYPVKSTSNSTNMDRIHIIGPKINEISASEISFSLFILLVVKDLSNKTHKDLRNLTFISDSIEGFTIRSIPRRFWCRISQIVINKGFSFRFLGETIISLYKKKYGQIINSVQVLMISSNPEMIRKWLDYTEEMREDLNARWRAKVDTWKKRIDCDFEWACKICPYFISCQKLQEVLESRKNLEI